MVCAALHFWLLSDGNGRRKTRRRADFFYFLYGLQTIAALRAARGSDLIETVLRLATVGLVGVTMAFYFFWGSSPDPVRGSISLAGCVITVLLSLLPVRAAKAP